MRTSLLVPIVILNWNGWDDTLRCVRAACEQGLADRLWVVDNGSEADCSAEVRAVDPRIELVFTGANLGWAGGNNVALRLAADRGIRRVFLLNNDAVLAPGAVVACEHCMDADDRIACVGGVITYGDGHVHFDGTYWPPGARTLADVAAAARDAGDTADVADVMGCAMLINLAAGAQMGWFDERFFCYGEEAEWCRRASRNGWRVVVARSAVVFHDLSSSDRNDNTLYYMRRNSFIELRDRVRDDGWWPLARTALSMTRDLVTLWRTTTRSQRVAYAQAIVDGCVGTYGPRRAAAGLRSVVVSAARRHRETSA